MKINKTTYFSIFLLVCFTSSFVSGIYKNYKYSAKQHKTINYKTITLNSKDESSSNSSEFLFEDNGIKNEDGLLVQIQPYELPYSAKYFQNRIIELTSFHFCNPTQKKTHPIYIEICNFRI